MQDHLLQFLPKGVDYKNSCFPPFVCSFMSFLFNFCSKNVLKSRNVSRSFSFYIWKITFFFFFSSECDVWLVKITAPFLTTDTVHGDGGTRFKVLSPQWSHLVMHASLPGQISAANITPHHIFDNGRSHTSMSLVPLFRHYLK